MCLKGLVLSILSSGFSNPWFWVSHWSGFSVSPSWFWVFDVGFLGFHLLGFGFSFSWFWGFDRGFSFPGFWVFVLLGFGFSFSGFLGFRFLGFGFSFSGFWVFGFLVLGFRSWGFLVLGFPVSGFIETQVSGFQNSGCWVFETQVSRSSGDPGFRNLETQVSTVGFENLHPGCRQP